MANGNFNIQTFKQEFLSNPDNVGLDLWDIVIEGGDSKETCTDSRFVKYKLYETFYILWY